MTDKKLHLRHMVTGLIVEIVPELCDDYHLAIRHTGVTSFIARTDVTDGKWEAVD